MMPRATFTSPAGRAFVYVIAAILLGMILTATFVGPAPLECGGGPPHWVGPGNQLFSIGPMWSCSTPGIAWISADSLNPFAAFGIGLVLIGLARVVLGRLARPRVAPSI